MRLNLYVGEKVFSIIPIIYTSKASTVHDSIKVQLIYYEKKRDGIVFEIPDELLTFKFR